MHVTQQWLWDGYYRETSMLSRMKHITFDRSLQHCWGWLRAFVSVDKETEVQVYWQSLELLRTRNSDN
jgi:hypothetical protein